MTMKNYKNLKGLAMALLLTVAGCAVGPDYHPPKMTVAPAYSELHASNVTAQASHAVTNTPSLQQWWTVFHDPELDSLIDRAVKGNRDLLQALSRVRQARAQKSVVASGLLPEIDSGAGMDYARGSQNVILPLNKISGFNTVAAGQKARATEPKKLDTTTAGSAPAGGPNNPFGLGGLPGVTTEIYQAGLDTSWDIDVFGGTRRAIEAAKATLQASEEDRRSVLVALLAEVATNYMELRSQQQRLEIARDNLATQRETLAILQARFTNGLSTQLDISQQTADVEATVALIPPLQSSERASLHLLAFLVGLEPSALIAELSPHQPLPAVPAEVPVGLPSDLLRRRPDIRRAERQLAAANAQIGQATAGLFPKFSLTAVAGLDSSQPGNLFQWGSRYFGLSPGVSWPVLDWGRIRGNIRVQNELEKQSLATYQSAVLEAFKEVEDALVFYANEQSRRASLARAVAASQDSLRLARKSYEMGLVDLLNVLSTERSLLNAQDALAQSDGAIRADLVKLYLALGGGWER
jgi:NodT family efflux transporter outer membrane factor (OMF) lipoprotein